MTGKTWPADSSDTTSYYLHHCVQTITVNKLLSLLFTFLSWYSQKCYILILYVQLLTYLTDLMWSDVCDSSGSCFLVSCNRTWRWKQIWERSQIFPTTMCMPKPRLLDIQTSAAHTWFRRASVRCCFVWVSDERALCFLFFFFFFSVPFVKVAQDLQTNKPRLLATQCNKIFPT